MRASSGTATRTGTAGASTAGTSTAGTSTVGTIDTGDAITRDRDPVIDLVRAGALGVVVAWHWAFTTLRWTSGGPRVGNPIGETPGMWVATWFLQVMPLFFLVGGALHARDRRDGVELVRNRFTRLVPPVVPLLGLAAAAALVAWAAGRPDVVRGVVLMITPLWFLAVYLVLVALTPLARRIHDRYGLRAVAAGIVAVGAVDRLTSAGHLSGIVPMLGEYVLTWAVVHQLGFHLEDLRRAPRAAGWVTCVGGFGLLAIGASLWGYPWSMVGTHPDPVSNMSPPNLMVVFLAIGQMGLVVSADRPLRSWATAHRGRLGTAGAWSMTVYVWHMLALAGFWGLVVLVAGDVNGDVDGGWWLQRPLWLLGPLLFAVPLFHLTGPGRGAAPTGPTGPTGQTAQTGPTAPTAQTAPTAPTAQTAPTAPAGGRTAASG